MHRVTLIYLDGSLYAYTDRKELKKRFKSQRSDKFVYDDTSVTENTYKRMLKNIYNKQLYLYQFRINWAGDNVNIVCTLEEYDQCLNESYEMDDALEKIYKRQVLQGNHNRKNREAIEYLIYAKMTKEYRENGTIDILSNENLFGIFLKKFHHLFKE